MKKTLTLLVFLLCTLLGNSKDVTVMTAQTVGYNYLLQKGSATVQSPADLQLLYTSGGSQALFYVFGGDHCFVIVSAEDGVVPVIGYSLKNTFKADNIPSNISGMLEGYNKQINYVKTNNIAAGAEIEKSWYNLTNNIREEGTAARTTTVSPLLVTTWDQYPYYNADCPADAGASSFGGHDVTGCVATATAQVMKFWSWPSMGTGFHSYSTSSYGTLSANFSSHTYNWSGMPNSISAPNAAIAQLMSDVGISVNMNYTPSESGAYVISAATGTAPYCAEYSLKNFFNYDPTLHGEQHSSYSDATWISMLEADLNAGRPIIYTGAGTGGGHCFVLDGFDASNNFHINWGWSGYSDGYFAINALNPAGTGAGGGAGGYNSDQTAILGVKPAGGGGGGGGGTSVDTLALYDYVNLSASTINYAGSFTITTNIGNFSVADFTGDYCAAAFDYTTGAFVTFIDSIMGASLPSLYSSGTLTFSCAGSLAMLPGMYTIGIFYRPTGGGWYAVWNYSSYTNFVPITVVIHKYMELSSVITPTPAPFVQGSAGSATLSIKNYGSTAFSGSYDVSIYNLDGSYNSTIQTMSGMALSVGASTGVLNFSTSSITAAPGTYFLALEFNDGTGWYLAGADYYTNPIYVTVVAPAPLPDIYEVNNTAATAYTLPLTFTGSVASTSTPGSNFHVVTDQDYYKIMLPAGYNYNIVARIDDIISSGGSGPYSTDAVWSYSTDGGTTWSITYDDVLTGVGSINLAGGAGVSVIFHVSPAFAGDLGTYMLQISSVVRAPLSIPDVDLSKVSIFPNPASDIVTVDLQQAGQLATDVIVTDVQGKTIYSEQLNNEPVVRIPVKSLSEGVYFIEVSTESGIIKRKITVAR